MKKGSVNVQKITCDLSQSEDSQKAHSNKESTKKDKKRVQKLQRKSYLEDEESSLESYFSSEETKNDDLNLNSQKMSHQVLSALKKLTKNFKLTFKQIKDSRSLEKYPLEEYSQKQIREIIRVQRQKLKRSSELDQDSDIIQSQKSVTNMNTEDQYRMFAKVLISEFESLDSSLSRKVLNHISSLIKEDNSLLAKCIQSQSRALAQQSLELFQERNFAEIENTFASISPMAAIILNFEISKKFYSFIDEGIFLSKTLLPYIDQCFNYDFIPQELNTFATRCAHTLIQYYVDSGFKITKGFAAYCLEFTPQEFQKIAIIDTNYKAIASAFQDLGFSKDCSEEIASFPQKFLYPDLINALTKLEKDEKENLVHLLAKLIILDDPGQIIQELQSKLGKRQIFLNLLLNHNSINLTVQRLIEILDQISGMDTLAIKDCLKQDPKFWSNNIKSALEREVTVIKSLDDSKIVQIFEERVAKLNKEKIVDLEEIKICSQEVAKECKNYSHSLYQCVVAAVCLSIDKPTKVLEMPTGSGKTWVYALIAQYYLKKGKKVTIIEPNQILCAQTTELIGNLSFELTITSVDSYYQFPNEDEVIIINEYHHIVQSKGYALNNQIITGLWNFKNKNTYFCTATTNRGLEKILHSVVNTPEVLKFQSEYELINQVSPLDGGVIKPCSSFDNLLRAIENEIIMNFDERPIIVICDENLKSKIVEILERNNIQKYRVGADVDTIKEIRSWDYGILILDPSEGVGVNTRFSKDSIVFIASKVENKAQYDQFLGRSSRTRGMCRGIYFCESSMSAAQIMENLNATNLMFLQNLGILLKFLDYKKQNQTLVNALETALEAGDKITSMKDISTIVDQKAYATLTKGFHF